MSPSGIIKEIQDERYILNNPYKVTNQISLTAYGVIPKNTTRNILKTKLPTFNFGRLYYYEIHILSGNLPDIYYDFKINKKTLHRTNNTAPNFSYQSFFKFNVFFDLKSQDIIEIDITNSTLILGQAEVVTKILGYMQ